MRKVLLPLFAALLFTAAASALDLGDKALPISPATWVTGSEADPTKADGNTIYLVEVWSTTCPPCVQSIPILNDLQKRYADQGFKIVSFTSDEEEQVRRFLEQHPMEYSSFIDQDGASYINYMAADNRNTIPHAFLFDRDGYLVWIGNPLDSLEAKIKAVIAGELTKDKAMLVQDARSRLQDAVQGQNVAEMLSALNDLHEIEPDNAQYYQVHYQILTGLGIGEPGEVQAVLDAWYKNCGDDPESLAILSMVAMDQGPPSARNPELAMAAAKRAYEMDSTVKLEAGLNLAEMYKSIGRVDLALELVKTLVQEEASFEHVEMLSAIENFYSRLLDLGKNPDAPYEPQN